jgi:hypothetical protein
VQRTYHICQHWVTRLPPCTRETRTRRLNNAEKTNSKRGADRFSWRSSPKRGMGKGAPCRNRTQQQQQQQQRSVGPGLGEVELGPGGASTRVTKKSRMDIAAIVERCAAAAAVELRRSLGFDASR